MKYARTDFGIVGRNSGWRRASVVGLLTVIFSMVSGCAADQPPAPAPIKVEAPDAAPWVQDLNGTWELAGPGSEEYKPIQVPGLWGQGGGKESQEWLTATFRREFTLPHASSAMIEFESITWGGEVLVNGHSAGTHDLGYAGCAFDLSAFVVAGANKLTVKPVGWKAIPRYPGGMTKIAVGAGNWFGNKSGGIPGDVRLRLFDGACIQQFRVYPQVLGVAQPGCKLSIPVRAGDKDFSGTIHVQVLSDDAKTGCSAAWQKPLTLKAGSSATVETDFIATPGATLWSCATPAIYRARVWIEKAAVAPAPAAVASVRDETFGLREVTIKDSRLCLNGKPVSLFGFTGVGAYFNFAMIADPTQLKTYQVDRFKQMNGIAFRCHQNPLLREWLDLCDRNGVLVVCEFNNFPDVQMRPADTIENPYDRPEYWANFQREITGLVNDRFNHPSIVMWSATNEGNGFSDWERANLYPYVKKQDATRPVIFSADVTPEVADNHNFCGNWWGSQADFDRIEADMATAYPTRLYGCTEFGQYQFGANFYGAKSSDKTRPPEYERDFGQILMEEIETLRRLRCGLILPFCVPYRNGDPWTPSEQFEAMRQAYAPLGLSLNTNNRHAVAGTELTLPVWVYSDAENASGDELFVTVLLLDKHPGFGWTGRNFDGLNILARGGAAAKVSAWGCTQKEVKFKLPETPVSGVLVAMLRRKGNEDAEDPLLAVSFRPLSTYAPLPKAAKPLVVEVLENGTAISDWLKARGHTVVPLMTEKTPDVVVIGEDTLTSGYLHMYQFMTLMRIKNGARLVILEQSRWSTTAFDNDLITGLEAVPTRGALEVLFPDSTMEAALGQAGDYRRLNGLEGVALRTGLQPPPPVAAPPDKIPGGLVPMPKETPPATTPPATPGTTPAPIPPIAPAAPPAGAPGDPPIPGSIPPAASAWKTWLAGYSHGLKKPDIAVAYRTYEKGEVIVCQVPLAGRLDAVKQPEAFDPVAERLLQYLIEGPRQP